jgi:hypothetical protein
VDGCLPLGLLLMLEPVASGIDMHLDKINSLGFKFKLITVRRQISAALNDSLFDEMSIFRFLVLDERCIFVDFFSFLTLLFA